MEWPSVDDSAAWSKSFKSNAMATVMVIFVICCNLMFHLISYFAETHFEVSKIMNLLVKPLSVLL